MEHAAVEHTAPELVTFGVVVLLGFVVVPLWMLMGLADYVCHRATHIERTAGTRESLLHLAQFGSVGIPLTAALFLVVNAALLWTMIAFIFLHHLIAYIDLRYANARRKVPPIEQMVHSFLELLPITAFLLVSALVFDQVQAVLGWSGQAPDLTFRWRNPALPWWYIAPVLVAAGAINLAPYVEELVRCLRAGRTANLSSPPVI